MSEIKDITNLEAEQDSGLGSLKNYIPPNIRMFVSDLLGSKEPFTEKDLLESDKKLLKEIAIGGMDKGFIDYEDYGVNSIDRNILRNILDDRYNLKTLLGQAKVMLNEDGELIAETDDEFYEYYYGDVINLYNEEEIDKLGYQWESSLVIGVDYYLYDKQYWVHGWASIIPISKGLTDYAFIYETGDIDFDIGLVAGYKFNRNIGVFGEGRYLKYFGISAYELKAGINVTIF